MIRMIILACALIFAQLAQTSEPEESILELDFGSEDSVITPVWFWGDKLLISKTSIPDYDLKQEVVSSLAVYDVKGCKECIDLRQLASVSVDYASLSAEVRFYPKVVEPTRLSLRGGGASIAEAPLASDWATWLDLQAVAVDTESDGESLRSSLLYEYSLSLASPLRLYTTGLVTDEGEDRRGDSYLSYRSLRWATEFRLGDSVLADAELGNQARIGGLRIRSDYDVRSSFFDDHRFAFLGEVDVPTVLDLYIDGEKRRSDRIKAGEFEYRDVNARFGSEVELRYFDAAGREQIISRRLFPQATQLPEGLWSYDVTVGLLRQSDDIYEDEAGAITLGYGIKDWLTLEGHFEQAKPGDEQYSMASIASTMATPLGSLQLAVGSSEHQVADAILRGNAYQVNFTTAVSNRLRFNYDARWHDDDFRRMRSTTAPDDFQRLALSSRFDSIGVGLAVTEIDDQLGYEASVSWSFGSVVAQASFSISENSDNDIAYLNLFYVPRVPGAGGVNIGVNVVDSDEQRQRTSIVQQSSLNHFLAMQASQSERLNEQGDWEDDDHFRADLAVFNDDWDLNLGARRSPFNENSAYQATVRTGFFLTRHGAGQSARLSERSGFLTVDTGVPLRAKLSGSQFQTDDAGRETLVVPGFRAKRIFVEDDQLPAGYFISSDVESLQVASGSSGLLKAPLSRAGVIIKLENVEADAVVVNDRRYPLIDGEAYIDQIVSTDNLVQVGDKKASLKFPLSPAGVASYIVNLDRKEARIQ